MAPLLLILLAGCIGADDPNAAREISLNDYQDCSAPRRDCQTEYESAIVVDALPAGNICLDSFDGFSVHLDPVTGALYLALDDEVRGYDHITGAFYQPSGSNPLFGVGSHIAEFTTATNGEHIRLNTHLQYRYAMADQFLFAFQGLNVSSTGELDRYTLSVDWLLVEEEFFTPVYSFYGSRYVAHFQDPAPVHLQGTDFGLDLKADVFQDGKTWHAIQNEGC